MTNCSGGWLADQKECCSSEVVRENLLKTLNLFIWERNPAKKGKCISEIYYCEGKHMQLKCMTLMVWVSLKILDNGYKVMRKEARLLPCKSIVQNFVFISSISKPAFHLFGQPCCFQYKMYTMIILKQLSAGRLRIYWQLPRLLCDSAYFNTDKFQYCHALFFSWSSSALDLSLNLPTRGGILAWNFFWEMREVILSRFVLGLNAELTNCSFFFATASATFNRSLYLQGLHFLSGVRPKVPLRQLISLLQTSAKGEK